MTAQSQQRPQLHFEKGECYLGQDSTTPVDMSQPQFSGLKETINRDKVTDGNYEWDADQRRLISVGGNSSKI